MQITIAPYLLSTYKLIQCAFPNGIETQDYLPLLALLYDQMSDRNLAEIVVHYTGRHYAVVLNDVYRVVTTDVPKAETIDKVKQRLLVCGYQEWLKEAES
ncbi:DUF3349 domain-containing protein [Nostoc sp. 'Lobaria pulmonaria (5183) cyanobiont']|uniref:DUF3349 domain-containing protein n=1 Tax=Nostoc sp. 'Lobaria pulmonaria (5183) cyanobiont' TaxID=1618022 RepID=UPI000CF34917|nr:DUF3349 domain-containing protein [Nostoc sp. 'Lobaria pulmonaria (5183) cyanobiont']AVH70133.1 protein of unknown function DUF3349 [Nostoc sp. 'Lobaria pulmonaria (5183) cyanobiont']